MMNKKQILSMSLSALLLTGCATVDPYSGEQKTSNTAKGAGIGAVTGAIIGAATASDEDRGKGALIGALGGAAMWVAVSATTWISQEAMLRERLQGQRCAGATQW